MSNRKGTVVNVFGDTVTSEGPDRYDPTLDSSRCKHERAEATSGYEDGRWCPDCGAIGDGYGPWTEPAELSRLRAENKRLVRRYEEALALIVPGSVGRSSDDAE